MGTNLSMNRSAALPDRRQPNAQCLTHGTATLSRTNQSDQDNFTGSERVFLSEKTYPAKGWTRGLAILREVIIVSRGKVPAYFPRSRCVVRLRNCRTWNLASYLRRIHYLQGQLDDSTAFTGPLPCSESRESLRLPSSKMKGGSTQGGPKVRIIRVSSACRRSIKLPVLVARPNAVSPLNSGYSTHPSK